MLVGAWGAAGRGCMRTGTRLRWRGGATMEGGRSVVVDLRGVRESYEAREGVVAPTVRDSPREPHPLFALWMRQAVELGVQEPNCVHLATCGPDGRPHGRVVLLKVPPPCTCKDTHTHSLVPTNTHTCTPTHVPTNTHTHVPTNTH